MRAPRLLFSAVVALVIAVHTAAGAQTAVVTHNAYLRTGPSSTHAKIRKLQPPDELMILDAQKSNDYYEVRTAGGEHGWVWSHNVQLTGAPAPASTATGPAEVYRSCPLEGSAITNNRKESNRKKNRITRPASGDIDANATLPAILQGGADAQRWSDARAASIVAYVYDVKVGGEETVNCGETDSLYIDTHIEVVLGPQDTLKTSRLIVEVTPRWRAFLATQGEDWTTRALDQRLEGRWVRFTGWLFWDFEHADEAAHTNPGGDHVWRATAWEIHPVTEIKVCPGTPATC